MGKQVLIPWGSCAYTRAGRQRRTVDVGGFPRELSEHMERSIRNPCSMWAASVPTGGLEPLTDTAQTLCAESDSVISTAHHMTARKTAHCSPRRGEGWGWGGPFIVLFMVQPLQVLTSSLGSQTSPVLLGRWVSSELELVAWKQADMELGRRGWGEEEGQGQPPSIWSILWALRSVRFLRMTPGRCHPAEPCCGD